MWSPVIDGKVQTGHFSEMIIKNKRHMVPLMMSNTSTESWDSPRVNSMEELEALAQEMFGDSAEKFLEAVKADTLDESIKNATFCPMELGMRLYFEATSKVRPELDNWGAVFDGEIPGWDNPGTFHSSDLWFVFESLASCWRPFTGKHYDLARHVSNYVSNFIKSGNPNGQDIDGTPMAEWKPYREAKGQMRYGHPSGQLPDSSVTPVTKFMTDYYLSQY
jgi:para-nitrobenzyl esterase